MSDTINIPGRLLVGPMDNLQAQYGKHYRPVAVQISPEGKHRECAGRIPATVRAGHVTPVVGWLKAPNATLHGTQYIPTPDKGIRQKSPPGGDVHVLRFSLKSRPRGDALGWCCSMCPLAPPNPPSVVRTAALFLLAIPTPKFRIVIRSSWFP